MDKLTIQSGDCLQEHIDNLSKFGVYEQVEVEFLQKELEIEILLNRDQETSAKWYQ